MTTPVPPGWMTRERAERLNAAMLKGTEESLQRFADRVAPLVAAARSAEEARAIMVREMAAVHTEIDQIVATTIERVYAGEDH